MPEGAGPMPGLTLGQERGQERVGGRIVVTGFGAFPGVADNPSAAVVAHLRGEPGLLPDDTDYRVIEVGYAAVGPALEAILAKPPRALVLTGYSALAEGLRLERRAHDACSPDHADAFGVRPAPGAAERCWLEPARDGPAGLDRLAGLDGLAEELAQGGIPCALSDDAGAYVCNHIYHQALLRIARQGAGTRAVFVHLPAITDTPLAESSAGSLPLDAMASGVAMIGRALTGP